MSAGQEDNPSIPPVQSSLNNENSNQQIMPQTDQNIIQNEVSPIIHEQTIQPSRNETSDNTDVQEIPSEARENDNNNNNENQEFPELPADIKAIASTRASKNEKSRFPHKLFTLLQWAGNDRSRSKISGCSWISDEEFFLDKSIICHHMNIKMNTLNVNLKSLGFAPSRCRKGNISFYKNNKCTFKSQSSEKQLEKIRKEENENLVAIRRGFTMPLLADIELYGMTKSEIDEFKKEVIITWESIVGEMVFAIGFADFMNRLSSHLQKQVYCNMSFIKLILCPKAPDIMEIFDFAVFMARFGPFQNSQLKIYQYRTILKELKPDMHSVGSVSPMSYFGPNFDNCFSFRHPNCGEYHCYNLPLRKYNAEFLVDEDGVAFKSWQKVIQANPFLSQMRNRMDF